MTERTAGPYIVWENYGYEGWQPKSYPTLREAVTAQRYQSEFVVTTLANFHVVECAAFGERPLDTEGTK